MCSVHGGNSGVVVSKKPKSVVGPTSHTPVSGIIK